MCPHVYVISVCLVFLSVGDLPVNTSKSPTDKNTKHVQMTYTCVIIQTQRTQISGRNSNGIKHSGGPPEDGREKRPKHVGVLHLQTIFNILLVLNVEVSVF
jgi:hypothetical protein